MNHRRIPSITLTPDSQPVNAPTSTTAPAQSRPRSVSPWRRFKSSSSKHGDESEVEGGIRAESGAETEEELESDGDGEGGEGTKSRVVVRSAFRDQSDSAESSSESDEDDDTLERNTEVSLPRPALRPYLSAIAQAWIWCILRGR